MFDFPNGDILAFTSIFRIRRETGGLEAFNVFNGHFDFTNVIAFLRTSSIAVSRRISSAVAGGVAS